MNGQQRLFQITLMLMLIVSMTSCSLMSQVITPRPSLSEFSGHYGASFEVSSFIPCDMEGLPDYGDGYWLESTADSGFYEMYRQLVGDVTSRATIDTSETIVFVRFKGELSPPASSPGTYGGYGHLGQYQREITVTEVLEMKPHANTQCAP